MKNRLYKNLSLTSIIAMAFVFLFANCEREISDAAVVATFPKTADIYTDNPVGLTDIFFHSDNPASGANPDGFNVDNEEAYVGKKSIRIDVPDPTDAKGGYVGGVFLDRGQGRNLTNYDALTFYVKASRTVTSGVTFGFGSDYLAKPVELVNKYRVSTNDISISTNWRKVTIPIPDASKLTQLKGLFILSAGTQGTGGEGFIFWLDEIRFEKLGTAKLNNPTILNGKDIVADGFVGTNQQISQIGASYNLADGRNVALNLSPNYFNFVSSDPEVATVNETGLVNVIGQSGSTTITAKLGNVSAVGSLKINSKGSFVNAPIPTRDAANVISIYSDTYSKIAGFNPGVFAGANTKNISIASNGGNEHVNYQSIDFLGIGWTGIVNASSKTTVHLDVQLLSGSNLVMELKDFGADGKDGGGDDTAGGRNISSQLKQGQWVGIDIPLNQFTLPTGGGGAGNPKKNNLGFIIFVSNNGASFLVDNIYFY